MLRTLAASLACVAVLDSAAAIPTGTFAAPHSLVADSTRKESPNSGQQGNQTAANNTSDSTGDKEDKDDNTDPDQWDATPIDPMVGGDGPTAFVIADEAKFTLEKTQQLSRLGISNVVRIDPVRTKSVCVDNDRRSTGTVMAHRHAWRSVLGLGRPALVLESDWTIGEQDEGRVSATLSEALDNSHDMTWLGYCEMQCDYGKKMCGGRFSPQDDPPLCLTGYVVTPHAADVFTAYNICSTVYNDGVGWETPDTSPPVDYFVDHKCETDLSCYVEAGPIPMPGCFGQGIFQQDATDLDGLHSQHHLDDPSMGPAVGSDYPGGWRASNETLNNVSGDVLPDAQDTAPETQGGNSTTTEQRGKRRWGTSWSKDKSAAWFSKHMPMKNFSVELHGSSYRNARAQTSTAKMGTTSQLKQHVMRLDSREAKARVDVQLLATQQR